MRAKEFCDRNQTIFYATEMFSTYSAVQRREIRLSRLTNDIYHLKASLKIYSNIFKQKRSSLVSVSLLEFQSVKSVTINNIVPSVRTKINSNKTIPFRSKSTFPLKEKDTILLFT